MKQCVRDFTAECKTIDRQDLKIDEVKDIEYMKKDGIHHKRHGGK